MAQTQDLIATAYRSFVEELPALAKLKLVLRLELRGRGDVQVYRIASPGPEITKVVPDDARLEIAMPRATLNELAPEGTIADWRERLDRGEIKIGGDPDVAKLLGTVIAKHEARSQVRRVR